MKDDMKARVEDYSASKESYSQKYDQTPLDYIKREDREQAKENKKLKKEEYKGRYS